MQNSGGVDCHRRRLGSAGAAHNSTKCGTAKSGDALGRRYSGALGTTDADQPTISVFLPVRWHASGAAMVICPGGTCSQLMSSYAGNDIARWLNSFGVAASLMMCGSDIIAGSERILLWWATGTRCGTMPPRGRAPKSIGSSKGDCRRSTSRSFATECMRSIPDCRRDHAGPVQRA